MVRKECRVHRPYLDDPPKFWKEGVFIKRTFSFICLKLSSAMRIARFSRSSSAFFCTLGKGAEEDDPSSPPWSEGKDFDLVI